MKAKDVRALPRSAVRYQLYRVRNEVEGGIPAGPEAAPFRKFFERQPGFTDWRGFARTWDVGEEGQHDRIMVRAIAEEQEWNARLNEAAVVIGGGEGTV